MSLDNMAKLLQEQQKDTLLVISQRDNLKEALEEVMSWIENWSPRFTDDEEWSDTEEKVRYALAAAED